MNFFFDLETLPAHMSESDKRSLAMDSVPGNYKDELKIQAWILEKGEEAYRKTSLDSMAGRILMMAWAVDNEPVESVYLDDPNDVRPILDALYQVVGGAQHVEWIGHNITGFDLPYLRHAAFKLRHPVAQLIPAVRYSPQVCDTMLMWAGTDAQRHVSLAKIAAFLGLGEKAGLDGSRVYQAWLDGWHVEIRAYGEQDVALVRDIYQVMSGCNNV